MELIFRIVFGILIGVVVGILVYFIYSASKRRVLKAVPNETRIEILRKHSKYGDDKTITRHTTQIVLNKPVPDILMKYNYTHYCNTESENKDDIVFSMLDFVCDNFRHDGNTPIVGKRSMEGVIRSLEKTGSGTNCRGLSLILAEVLRMNGIKARHVTCKPFEEPFSDCHVVVDCVLPSGERIMLDPTYRLYFTDDNGRYVSIAELRKGIIQGKVFHPNGKASYNGGSFDYDGYIEYMTKNLLRFNSNYILNDTDSIRSEIELIPVGYSVKGYPEAVQYTTDEEYFWDMN